MSLEEQGPQDSNRWLDRSTHEAHIWADEWQQVFDTSPGPVPVDSPVERWPFACARCGADFHGLKPWQVRAAQYRVAQQIKLLSKYASARTVGLPFTVTCCKPHQPVTIIWRVNREGPAKTFKGLTLVDISRPITPSED